MTDEKQKGRKMTGDKETDLFIENLGLDLTEGEIKHLRLVKTAWTNGMGMQRLHDTALTMYRVKSNERLAKSNKIHSWVMAGVTVGLFIVAALKLIFY